MSAHGKCQRRDDDGKRNVSLLKWATQNTFIFTDCGVFEVLHILFAKFERFICFGFFFYFNSIRSGRIYGPMYGKSVCRSTTTACVNMLSLPIRVQSKTLHALTLAFVVLWLMTGATVSPTGKFLHCLRFSFGVTRMLTKSVKQKFSTPHNK